MHICLHIVKHTCKDIHKMTGFLFRGKLPCFWNGPFPLMLVDIFHGCNP